MADHQQVVVGEQAPGSLASHPMTGPMSVVHSPCGESPVSVGEDPRKAQCLAAMGAVG